MAGLARAVNVSLLLLVLAASTTGLSSLRPPIVEDTDGNKADENSDITWAKHDSVVQYKMDGDSFNPGSLKALFNMANGFIDVVMPKDVPYDLILDGMSGKFDKESQDTVVKTTIGFAICLAIGILLALCVPFVGCCFCCCRCCGKCGGKRVQAKPTACRCWCYTITLVVCCVMTCCGACLMLKINENAKSTGDSIEAIGKDNLDDLATFLDTSAKDLKFIGVGGFRFVGKVVMRDLDNMDILVGEEVVSNLEVKGHATEAVKNIITFDDTVKKVAPMMEKLHNDEVALKTKGVNLTSELSDRKGALKSIHDSGDCHTCATYFDINNLAMDADYAALPFILPQVYMVKAIAANDPSLAASAMQGKKDLDDIPQKVLNDSLAQRNDVRKLLDDFVSTVSNQTAKIEELQKTLDVPSKKSELSDAVAPLSSGNSYSWYGGIGLGGMVLFIVLLQVIGLALGMCGYGKDIHPEDRSSASNVGGNCLMASVAFTLIFFALFMVFLMLLFTVGVPAQKLLCEPLMDPEFTAMDTLLDGKKGLLHNDGYFLGNLLLQNKSIPLTFKSVLSDCRDNKPSYSALRLDAKFDLDEMANYADKIDINDTMSKIDVNLSSVALLSDTTETLLRNFSTAVQLDYQAFRDELEKNTTKAGKNLADFIQNVTNAANDAANLNAKTRLNDEVVKLQTLNDNLLKNSTRDQAALLVDVNKLNSTTKTIPTEVDDMISSAKKAEKYIQEEGSDMVKMVTQNLVNRILSTADQFTNHLLSSVKKDMMRCKPIWNLWKSIVHGAVCGYGVQTLNGFWFALGWSLFFLFIGMIFSVKTAKYFHKMTGGPPAFRSGKVGHYDGDGSRNY